jgi:chemotaxis protein histidine kinase CheA
MPADSGRQALSGLLARARVAILALAPDDTPDSPPPVDAEAAARASAALGALAAALEHGEDPLRVLLAVDMAQAVDMAVDPAMNQVSLPTRGRGKLVAVLIQALSVLAADPLADLLADPPADSLADNNTDELPALSSLALINELRALRGAPLLSGNIVFAVAVDAVATAGGEPHEMDPRLAASARRLRSYYQQGLVAWLSADAKAKAGAGRIAEVFARLHALSQGSHQEPLWRAASGFANLLRDVGWRRSTAIKRLLGQLDGQLKRLAEGGAVLPDVPPALVQNLLFYVGEGRDVDTTISVFPSRTALLAAFAAPSAAHPDQPTAVLSLLNELLAISGQLMEALAPGETWPGKRSWLVERLLHVADGLGLLSAHPLRRRAMQEIDLLRHTPGSGDPPPGGWGRVAERLHALGAELLTTAGMEPAAAVAEDTAGMPSSGRIARRLEADLVHAEAVIRRLEQEPVRLPAEPPAQAVAGGDDHGHDASDADAEAAGAAAFRQRFDAFAGDLRAEQDTASADPMEAAQLPAASDDLPEVALDHALLDDIAGAAADIDASRSRLEQQVGAVREGLQDMDNAIRGVRENFDALRAQIEALRTPHDADQNSDQRSGRSSGQSSGQSIGDAGQLPAEGSGMRHRLERLASGLAHLSELRDGVDAIAADSRSVLVQQAREHVALGQRLMQSRLQPLDVQLGQLSAEIAERAAHAGKQVLMHVDAGELRIEPEKLAALLPVLRSLCVSMIESGVEPPRVRVLAGRAPGCLMEMRFRRRGADLTMVLTADCRAPAPAAMAEAQRFLRPLGGLLELAAASPHETLCRLQMPLAPRVSTVLLVSVDGEILALPLAEVQAVLQCSSEELEAAAESGIEHDQEHWQIGRLNALLGFGQQPDPAPSGRRPLVLVACGAGRHALVVDAIGERADVVVRSVAPQLRCLGALAGAAILGDGQVVLLLDVGALMERRAEPAAAPLEGVF